MNTKYRVLIIEDEEPARNLIIKYLKEFPDFEIGSIATDGIEAEFHLSNSYFDLIFLDVNLPLKNGIEIIKEKALNNSVIIFSTALDSVALNAFELGAQDYLLKPYDFSRFKIGIQKALRLLRKNSVLDKENSPYLNFSSNYSKHRVLHTEIQFISANNSKSILHCVERDYEINELFSKILNRLPANLFLRIHKSYAINKLLIESIISSKEGGSLLRLSNEDETTLPVGKKYKQVIKSLLANK